MGNNNRKTPPVEGGLQHFEIPAPEERVLSQGNIISHYQRSSIPLINMIMSFPYGALDENENERGLLNLLCSVLDEGTETKTSLEFSDAVEFLGSSLSIQADYEHVVVSLQSLSEKFEETLQLFREMLKHPRFDEKDFSREKNNILVRLRQAKDLPEAIAERAYRNIVYRDCGSYGLSAHGTINELSGIDLSRVQSWYGNNMQTSIPDIFSAGDVGIEELQQLLKKYQLLDGVPYGRNEKEFAKELPVSQIYIIDKPESVQTEIVIGHLTNKRTDKDYLAKVILNMIFGGQFSSRLNLNLREKNGLTYGVHSSFSYHVNAADFRISTSVSSADTGKAIQEILIESAKIGEDISKEEIDFSRASLVNRFTLNFETYGQLVSNSFSRRLFSLPGNYYENYVSSVLAVKEDDVRTAAQNRICKDNYQIVLVGNAKDIEDSLIKNGIDIPVQKISNESLW
jgi:zinc protease